MISADAATSSIGKVSATNKISTPDQPNATCGVRVLALTELKLSGKARSRPMAKLTRVDEKVVAFKALMVDSRPPTMMRKVPKGMNWAAARAMPISPSSPSHSNISTPSGGSTAPMMTNATSI